MMKRKAQNSINNTSKHTLLKIIKDNPGNLALVDRLIKAGANVNAWNSQKGTNPLIFAVRLGNKTLVDLLLKAGANVNAEDDDSNTALMWAVRRGNKTIVTRLLKAGADVHVINDDGENAMWIAIYRDDIALVDCLLNGGAGLNLMDVKVAIQNESYDVAVHLLKKLDDKNQNALLYLKGLTKTQKIKLKMVDKQKRQTPVTFVPMCNKNSLVTVMILHDPAFRAIDKLYQFMNDLRSCPFSGNLMESFLQQKGKPVVDCIFIFDNLKQKCIAGASFSIYPNRTLELHYLCSSKTCRGAGSTLITSLESYARERNVKKIILFSDYNALGFYNKLGFLRVSGNKRMTHEKDLVFKPIKRLRM